MLHTRLVRRDRYLAHSVHRDRVSDSQRRRYKSQVRDNCSLASSSDAAVCAELPPRRRNASVSIALKPPRRNPKETLNTRSGGSGCYYHATPTTTTTATSRSLGDRSNGMQQRPSKLSFAIDTAKEGIREFIGIQRKVERLRMKVHLMRRKLHKAQKDIAAIVEGKITEPDSPVGRLPELKQALEEEEEGEEKGYSQVIGASRPAVAGLLDTIADAFELAIRLHPLSSVKYANNDNLQSAAATTFPDDALRHRPTAARLFSCFDWLVNCSLQRASHAEVEVCFNETTAGPQSNSPASPGTLPAFPGTLPATQVTLPVSQEPFPVSQMTLPLSQAPSPQIGVAVVPSGATTAKVHQPMKPCPERTTKIAEDSRISEIRDADWWRDFTYCLENMPPDGDPELLQRALRAATSDPHHRELWKAFESHFLQNPEGVTNLCIGVYKNLPINCELFRSRCYNMFLGHSLKLLKQWEDQGCDPMGQYCPPSRDLLERIEKITSSTVQYFTETGGKKKSLKPLVNSLMKATNNCLTFAPILRLIADFAVPPESSTINELLLQQSVDRHCVSGQPPLKSNNSPGGSRDSPRDSTPVTLATTAHARRESQ